MVSPVGIYIFDNVFSDEMCTRYINFIKTHAVDIKILQLNTNINGKEIVLTGNSQSNIFMLNEITKVLVNLSNVIEDLTSIHDEYKNKISTIKITGSSEYLFRELSGKTKLHSDGILTDPRAPMVDTNQIRCMSIIGAFNDYDGGVIHFPMQNIDIKLKKGQVLAFPPYWTHPHVVSAPENETIRYTFTTWLYGGLPR